MYMSCLLGIDMLTPGMIVEKNINNTYGSPLIRAGIPLTEANIRQLKSYDYITEVPIILSEEEKRKYQYDNNIIPTVSTGVIKGAAKTLKNINGPLTEASTISIIEYAKRITDDIYKSNDFTYRLTDYKANPDQQEHIVRTAVYAVTVAKAYNASINDSNLPTSEKEERKIPLDSIATAALLRDIGKLCSFDKVRLGIRNYATFGGKLPTLTQEKIEELKKKYDEKYYLYYGYNMLTDPSLTATMKKIFLFSGEDNIGNGPFKIVGFRNSTDKHIVAAKIINLCSKFDRYMMENIKDEITLENAYYQFRDLFTTGAFDDNFLDYFLENIPLYPTGTKVKLHGGVNEFAIVAQTFQDQLNYSKPMLITIPGKEVVDLRNMRDTTIKQVVGSEIKAYELLKESDDIKEEEVRKIS